jgi:F0F1-type ATP synthase assembly protein I
VTDGRRRPRGPWQEAIDVGSIGIEMAVAMSIGFFGGQWIDGRVGTAPWLQWIGLGLGVAAAGLALVRVARRYLRDDDRDDGGSAQGTGDGRG